MCHFLLFYSNSTLFILAESVFSIYNLKEFWLESLVLLPVIKAAGKNPSHRYQGRAVALPVVVPHWLTSSLCAVNETLAKRQN